MMSESSKLAQKDYKTRLDWVSKVICWELCKKLKIGLTNKWYMHKPASVLEAHKLLWDFDVQTDHLLSARRTDLIIINKKEITCRIVEFAVSAAHRVKLKVCKKRDKYLDSALELKKPQNLKVTIIPIVIGVLGTITEGLVQGLEDLEITVWLETVQTTALLISARILRKVLET